MNHFLHKSYIPYVVMCMCIRIKLCIRGGTNIQHIQYNMLANI